MNREAEHQPTPEELGVRQETDKDEIIPEAPTRFEPSVEKSAWSKMKSHVLELGLAASLTMGGEASAQTRTREQFPDQRPEVVETQRENIREKIAEAERLYASDFEKSPEDSVRLYKTLESINNSPEFKTLDRRTQAELLHREGFTKLSVNKTWLKDGYRNFSPQDAEGLRSNYQEIAGLFDRAIQTETQDGGELTPERERSIVGLIDTARAAAHDSIYLEVNRPDLKQFTERLKSEANDPVERAMELDPRMRYVGNGLYIFSEKNKEQATRPVIGIAKFTGDLPPDISDEQALRGIGGAHYDISKEVIPWANAVKSGLAKSTTSEKTFIDSLVRQKILTVKGDGFAPGETESLIISPPDETKFSHEMAHEVERVNPEFLQKAKTEYQGLNSADRQLFDSFMKKQNPDLSEEHRMREFFAYTHQAGDWRNYARSALGIR